MDAEKFVLTVFLALAMAGVVAVSLALAKRFHIKLPWDARIAGCPRCGAGEEFGHGVTLEMIGNQGPVVRASPRYGSTTDLVNIAALMGGITATLIGCVLLLTGVAAWVVELGDERRRARRLRADQRGRGDGCPASGTARRHVGLAPALPAPGREMQMLRLARKVGAARVGGVRPRVTAARDRRTIACRCRRHAYRETSRRSGGPRRAACRESPTRR